jgi:uncharacterized UBP type Zn finger protein
MLLTASPFAPSLAAKALLTAPPFAPTLAGKVGDLARSIVSLSKDLKVPATEGCSQPAESTAVKIALGPFNEMFLTNAQQDAHECFTTILGGLKETDNEKNEVFGFTVDICRECESCKHNKWRPYRIAIRIVTNTRTMSHNA